MGVLRLKIQNSAVKIINVCESFITRNSVDQSTKMNVAETGKSTSHVLWEGDLEDILENIDPTLVSQPAFGSEMYLFQDPLTFPSYQAQMQTHCAPDLQSNSHPGITVQSDFQVFSEALPLEIVQTGSGEVWSRNVPNANVTDNVNQSIDLASIHISPYFMNLVTFGRKESSTENSFGS